MKKLLLLSIVALTTLGACQKDFLDTKPTDQISESIVFTDLKNARAALNGIHRLLYSQGDQMDQNGEQSHMIIRDLLGEDLCMSAAGNGWWNDTYKWNAHRNARATNTTYAWKFYYRVIFNVNGIIEGLNKNLKAQETDPNFKEIMGQALTYRAWAYFNLVQLYAQRYDYPNVTNSQPGVVLRTTQTVTPQARATVEEVYAQINKDLDEAIILLADAKDPNQISDISLQASQAIKARVALTTGRWADAISNATAAIKGHSLFSKKDLQQDSGYPSVFSSYPGEGSEWIWGTQQASDQPTYFFSYFAFMSWNFSSTNIRTNPKSITRELYEAMPATDARKSMFSLTGMDIKARPEVNTSALVCSYMSRKFRAAANSDSRGDIAYIRVAEMYLIKAEAEARSNKFADAQQTLFDLVSTRDNAYVKSTSTDDALINEILLQRRIELWGEGFRFYDLKRLNSSLERNIDKVVDPAAPVNPTEDELKAYKKKHIYTDYAGHHSPTLCYTTSVNAGDVRWQWVIPQDEINSNPEVKQNN
ncbi:RagB/SusD family nutrient uptake outer membrane protein [Acetobacteroides hydrogenigenes]|nr:RagB/SusD family nutrient uptake outer membrane protein [Acetobacteroides hydrogenigenes]